MRSLLQPIWVLLMIGHLAAQDDAGDQQSKREEFDKGLPTVNFTMKVLDEEGRPIEGAKVVASDHFLTVKHESRSAEGVTDAEGSVSLSFKAITAVGTLTTKKGYYPSIAPAHRLNPLDPRFKFHPFTKSTEEINAERAKNPSYEPEMKKNVDLNASVVMRKIQKPIPLITTFVTLDIPVPNEWIGFDFELGDMVKPHGKGLRSDMKIRSTPLPNLADPGDAKGTLEISFGEGGGLIRVNEDNGWLAVSRARMPHIAPEAGYDQLSQLKLVKGIDGVQAENGLARAYFFRTRVEKKDGVAVSAHYGKIPEWFKYSPYYWANESNKRDPVYGQLKFAYRYNPKANDRNLEFDENRKLAPGRK